MLNVTCEKFTASVEAKGLAKDLFYESLGLIVEGFKLIRKLDNKLYEKAKEDLFMGILFGKLDDVTTPTETSESQEFYFDLDALREQLKQEEGEN